MASDKREYTFAQTFSHRHSRHVLYYWLAAAGINPMKDAKIITVPPAANGCNMRIGNMDGYCVGEPWGHRAIADGIGITSITTQDIWKDHPEKVLGTTNEFVQKHPNTARAMTMAVLEAGRWIDTSLSNTHENGGSGVEYRLRQYLGGCHQSTHTRRYQNGLGQDLGRSEPYEILQRRCGEFSVSVGRHVVPDAAQALGIDEAGA
jgi:nitrate/nitrite transport system substrate-binding protein